jgi:biopolymer transport protein ExbB/TolQ
MQPVEAKDPAAAPRVLGPVFVCFGGFALTAAFYAGVYQESLADTLLYRYFCGHPIEMWTTGLFFWGVAALGAKLVGLAGQWHGTRLAQRLDELDTPIPVADADQLSAALDPQLRRLGRTWMGRRIAQMLAFVQARGTACGLDDRLRELADHDAGELDASYSLVRFVTWAIPILGFLGTVVGITIAIAHVTPEQLESSLSQVTGGLAVAFDTTALALALSMGLMFLTFLVERTERSLLARVDRLASGRLAHVFEQHDAQTSQYLSTLHGMAQVIFQATREAWREQIAAWTEAQRQATDQQIAAFGHATAQWLAAARHEESDRQAQRDRQFQTLAERLEQLQSQSVRSQHNVVEILQEAGAALLRRAEEVEATRRQHQDAALDGLLDTVAAVQHSLESALQSAGAAGRSLQAELARFAELLGRVCEDGGRLHDVQTALNQNLSALAGVAAFDEAVHSLTAAVHILSARTGRSGLPTRLFGSEAQEAAA